MDGQLGLAAPWADTVKYETAYEWSKPWHFVDAEDDPLGGTCNVQPSRDCGTEGCILSAITNYTARMQDTSLSKTQRGEALKFLTHFLGDNTQPLHCENYEVGGNDIVVTYDGEKTELHAVWDTNMIETLLAKSYDNSTTNWADALVTRIKTGSYKSEKASWVTCDSPSLGARGFDPRSSGNDREMLRAHARTLDLLASDYSGFLTCPVEWASDANAFDCSTVFKGYNVSDLYPSYYNANIDTVELQIAKAGYRLAAWLNMMIDGTAFPSGN